MLLLSYYTKIFTYYYTLRYTLIIILLSITNMTHCMLCSRLPTYVQLLGFSEMSEILKIQKSCWVTVLQDLHWAHLLKEMRG